ncbi:carboxymuconolactone decarboxylase family protein [Seohaeicola zhoushanensis]|uniref:Alkyl hydroperoxide reductase AhpD n=1 Tax=Seohaeicola zhoushanensis TaxID=1569283 RepID=A0A8J3M8E3_9RHOB|nr:carboxymuconolactone decarboxylase family protein [Seohaeicola zhoushanensis]GHF52439.1 alkyl hydroperoxide reductase AhpD [Seohaeicola zhoushanensis]
MPRITLPGSIDAAPTAAQPLLEAVRKSLGSVPNLFRITANSPVALEGYLGLSGALAKGRLSPQTRERIALAVAQINGCDYCLSAHSYLGRNLAKLDEAEIAANRNGHSSDPKADAAVQFAAQLVQKRGQVSEAEVSAVKLAGYGEAEIVEIVAHVALNTLTNYLNEALDTPIDFAVVSAEAA